jgi:hypothetical protein
MTYTKTTTAGTVVYHTLEEWKQIEQDKKDVLKLAAVSGLDYAANLLGLEELIKVVTDNGGYLRHDAVVVDNARDAIESYAKQGKLLMNKAAARLVGRFNGDENAVVVDCEGAPIAFFFISGPVDFSITGNRVAAYPLQGTGEVENWGDFIY